MSAGSRAILAFLSGVLLVLAFPGFDIEVIAWVALVPLFFALDGLRPRQAFFIAYLAGAVFFLGTIYWLIHVTLPGMFVVVLYLALYVGAFGALVPLLAGRDGKDLRPTDVYLALFAIPAAWTVLEWARSHFLTGFGWNLLGYSQSYSLPVIQIADTVGVYGVGALVVLVNAAIYITAKEWRAKRADVSVIAIALFLVFLSVAYGIIRLKTMYTGEPVKVAVVQGNIPQERKWDSVFRREILTTYEDLTRKAAAEQPDLIIWPETSVPGFLEGEQDLRDAITALAREVRIPLLVGTVREGAGGDYYNSASFIAMDGTIAATYDKVHLVPFGEYIPFKKALSFVEKFAPVPIGDCSAGTERTVFSFMTSRSGRSEEKTWRLLKKVSFSCLVCFEDVFPELAREFVRNRAQFLVVITNDAWYKRSFAPYQHAQNSIFRAVENRVPVVRAANTGVSCVIDRHGRVSAVVAEGENTFVAGWRTGEVVIARVRTWYTLYGDVFVYGCMVVLAFGLFRKKQKASSTE